MIQGQRLSLLRQGSATWRKASRSRSNSVAVDSLQIVVDSPRGDARHSYDTSSTTNRQVSITDRSRWSSSADSAPRASSLCARIVSLLQGAYERSHVHHVLPILILVSYSFLGGSLFYAIEHGAEQRAWHAKTVYTQQSRDNLTQLVDSYRQRVCTIIAGRGADCDKNYWATFTNYTDEHRRRLKYVYAYASPRLHRHAYWYALSVYYLSQESAKATTLQEPEQPEQRHRESFETPLGRLQVLDMYLHQLAERCWEIVLEADRGNFTTAAKVDDVLQLFHNFSGLPFNYTRTWTFWNSMFLAVTTYTTIGYGNIVPKTPLGKLFAIIYAIVGIPMVLMILHKFGRLFLKLLQGLWDYMLWLAEQCNCIQQTRKSKPSIIVDTSSGRESYSIPVTLAISVTFAWIFACAGIFLYFEPDWDYFKSFYFIFISLTTIGFGDVVPSRSEDVFVIFGLLLIGLSLVSMCINVVQIKLEHLINDLLIAMMEEYASAQEAGIPTAPPDIRGRVGVLQLWRMWKRRRQSDTPKEASSGSTARRLRLAGQRRGALLAELAKFARQRNKATQTDPKRLAEAAQSSAAADDDDAAPGGGAGGGGGGGGVLRTLLRLPSTKSGSTSVSGSDMDCGGEIDVSRHTSPVHTPRAPRAHWVTQLPEPARSPPADSPPAEPWFVCIEPLSPMTARLVPVPLSETQPLPRPTTLARLDPVASGAAERHCQPVNDERLVGGAVVAAAASLASVDEASGDDEDLSSPGRRGGYSRTTGYTHAGGYHAARKRMYAKLSQTGHRPSLTTERASSPCSVASAPVYGASIYRPVETAATSPMFDFDPNRRWTFFDSRRASIRGTPRGLVPTMWLERRAKPYNDDLKSLMREIDVRLNDCRSIVDSRIADSPKHSCSSSFSQL